MVEEQGALLPSGIIAMWSGLLANIPSGWALCDGLGGRPDLRDKFVVGASPGQDPGGTGGSLSLSHSGMSVDNHPAGITGDHSGVADKKGTAASAVAPSPHTHSIPELSHSVTQPADHSDIRPPFYKVAYIIKL